MIPVINNSELNRFNLFVVLFLNDLKINGTVLVLGCYYQIFYLNAEERMHVCVFTFKHDQLARYYLVILSIKEYRNR